MWSQSYHGDSFHLVTDSDSGDDFKPDSRSHTSSESDDKMVVSSRVAKKKKKRPKSRDLPTATHRKAPDSMNKCAVFEGAVYSEQSLSVSNDRNTERPVQSSKIRREEREELIKKEAGIEDHAPGDLRRFGGGKILPPRLIQMWTEIDPALPRAAVLDIFQSTFAEFRLAITLGAQPWMQTDNKSSDVAIEKARISNDGKIPASWRAAAEQSEHGRKWMKIEREQKRAEALARARENVTKTVSDEAVTQRKVNETAALYNEMTRKAQYALEASKSAARQAKEAKEAAEKACEEADQARIIFLDCTTARDTARLAASSAAAECKTLEEETKEAAKVAPPNKKRKLGAFKTEDP